MIFRVKLLTLCGLAHAALFVSSAPDFHRTVEFDGTRTIFRQRAQFSDFANDTQTTRFGVIFEFFMGVPSQPQHRFSNYETHRQPIINFLIATRPITQTLDR